MRDPSISGGHCHGAHRHVDGQTAPSHAWYVLPVADAFGLALFTVIGAQKALNFGTPGLIAVIMGTMTGLRRHDP